jgi:hypothetical protein
VLTQSTQVSWKPLLIIHSRQCINCPDWPASLDPSSIDMSLNRFVLRLGIFARSSIIDQTIRRQSCLIWLESSWQCLQPRNPTVGTTLWFWMSFGFISLRTISTSGSHFNDQCLTENSIWYIPKTNHHSRLVSQWIAYRDRASNRIQIQHRLLYKRVTPGNQELARAARSWWRLKIEYPCGQCATSYGQTVNWCLGDQQYEKSSPSAIFIWLSTVGLFHLTTWKDNSVGVALTVQMTFLW